MSLREHVCELNRQTGEVLINGKIIVLRPKTFELLCLLASNPKAIHSKSEILATVWHGAVVEEQVIFQSINEIRKEIGLSEAIKTYPRRGYKWEIPISIINDGSVVPAINAPEVKLKQAVKSPVALITVIIVTLLITFLVVNKNASINRNEDLVHKGILILPFDVSSMNEHQQWLRYGGMEGLIRRISPNKDMTVFHLEDVIEILNRIDVGERRDIIKIFAKSGASHILQTSLSGNPGEFNVVYTIYSRTNRMTHTVQANTIEHVFTSLVNIFEEAIGENLASEFNVFDQGLQNDLIAKALKFLEIDDLTSALPFIQSAVINDPDNILASYLLVKINMELNQIDQVLVAVDTALGIAERKPLGEYKHRLQYFKGAGLAASGELTQAEMTLLESKDLARKNNDWLYYAYSQSILAKIKLIQNQHQEAFTLFQSALEYQTLLNCPMGIAQGYLDFVDYYLKTGDQSIARQEFKKAETLAHEKNLIQILPLLSEIKSTFE